MPAGRGAALSFAVSILMATLSPALSEGRTPRPGPGGSRLLPVRFDDLPGWSVDDHAAAFAAFRRSCAAIAGAVPALRPGLPTPQPLLAICRDAAAMPQGKAAEARRFFETRFSPWRIEPASGGAGFLTGYYEPVVDAALVRSPGFPVPVLGRPADLETLSPGPTVSGLDPALAAARRTPSGLEPFPDRAAIQDGALDGHGLEIAWVRDEVELFMMQVQGSARLRLPDNRLLRLVYAGRNGHPYTSIGRVIVEEGRMSMDEMSLERLKAWLRANEAEARRIMRLNRSYIFFALGEGMDPAEGPIGAASVPLVPLRSIAVDRGLWPYGLPFHISAVLPGPGGGPEEPFTRLMMAHDTGSAILGPARADLFMGTGDAAGTRAGLVRHPGTFTVLLPRAENGR
jgi:membrane-bound lytic murein transglycosylase A